MTKEQIVIAVLGASCLLLLFFHLAPLFRRLGRAAIKKHTEREAEKQALADNAKANSEIPLELLLVLLTAAANSALAPKYKSAFRVVSFRRTNKK